jgi:hypothetical protein
MKLLLFLILLVCQAATICAMNFKPSRLCFKISQDDQVCFFKSRDGNTYQLDIESLYSLGDKPSFLALSSKLIVCHEEVSLDEVEYVSIDFEFRLNELRQTIKSPNFLYKEMTAIIEQNQGDPKLRAEFSKFDLDLDEIARRIKQERRS